MNKVLFVAILPFVVSGCSKSADNAAPPVSLVGGTWTHTETKAVEAPKDGRAATSYTAPATTRFTYTFYDTGNVDRLVGATGSTMAYTYRAPTLSVSTTPGPDVYTVSELSASRLVLEKTQEDATSKNTYWQTFTR